MKKYFNNLKVDKVLFWFIISTTFFGLIIFFSASLGIFTKDESKFFVVIKSQFFYTFLGLIFFLISTQIDYNFYKKYTFWLFILSVSLCILLFLKIPAITFCHNGACRWLHFGPISFQPSEFLKFTSISMVAIFCIKFRKNFNNYKIGFLPFFIFSMLIGILIAVFQKDFGSFAIIITSSFLTFFLGGAKGKDILLFIILGIVGFFALLQINPHMKERILTYLHPDREILGASFQYNQSLIGIGSGRIFGKGFGQSLQKFTFLPEQISDSIFVVYAEEYGFIGNLILFSLFIFIIYRSLTIAKNIKDEYAKLLIYGIISIFFLQIFLNIGSNIGTIPFTGVTLPFISKGGTSLVFLLFMFGIILNISKNKQEEKKFKI